MDSKMRLASTPITGPTWPTSHGPIVLVPITGRQSIDEFPAIHGHQGSADIHPEFPKLIFCPGNEHLDFIVFC
jgi:hypothetical protein